ncbi:hypothetical protein [Flavobacterium sp.]|uniref:hypothetical protein n=1 Tax=Flavobacterium sp. TaxID=239 RepID=UPI002607C79F|nr:hypothetical protein [Flavobacterium sp.]
MKTQFRNFAFVLPVLVTFLFTHNATFAQQNPFSWNNQANSDDIVMTWNKNTPESEMKDDIKALGEKGITIKYSGVKRNSKEEITAIKVEYSDRKGNKGKMELDNTNPIATIKFFKQGDTVGFGEPSNGNDFFAGNPMMGGFAGADELMKRFNFGGDKNSQSYSFTFPNDGDGLSKSKSRIQIQKDGRKPLVIEDGVVIEGADDYSTEEIEEIKKNNKFEFSDGFGNNLGEKQFDFRSNEGLENFKKQMEEMKSSFGSSKEDGDLKKTKEEMQKAKEEMVKAKEELEKARLELEKAKATTKIRKT